MVCERRGGGGCLYSKSGGVPSLFSWPYAHCTENYSHSPDKTVILQ